MLNRKFNFISTVKIKFKYLFYIDADENCFKSTSVDLFAVNILIFCSTPNVRSWNNYDFIWDGATCVCIKTCGWYNTDDKDSISFITVNITLCYDDINSMNPLMLL